MGRWISARRSEYMQILLSALTLPSSWAIRYKTHEQDFRKHYVMLLLHFAQRQTLKVFRVVFSSGRRSFWWGRFFWCCPCRKWTHRCSKQHLACLQCPTSSYPVVHLIILSSHQREVFFYSHCPDCPWLFSLSFSWISSSCPWERLLDKIISSKIFLCIFTLYMLFFGFFLFVGGHCCLRYNDPLRI